MTIKTTVCIFVALHAICAVADVHYVSTNSVPSWPYTNWNDAAASIAEGLSAAGDGDTVVVGPGHYPVTSQVAISNAIVMESASGASDTIVDGGGVSRCFFVSGADAVVSGFTVQNGLAYDGGGVWCEYGASVKECIIRRNIASNDAGGVYCANGATVENCLIEENSSGDDGGGAYIEVGGTLRDSELTGNLATGKGGALDCRSGSMFVENCLIVSNTALVQDSGGLGSSGGGIYCREGTISIDNCTIAYNTAATFHGGVSAWSGNLTIRNTILYFNSGEQVGNVVGQLSCLNCCTTSAMSGDNNITNAPLFLDPDASDFRLMVNSPCIDTGMHVPTVTSDLDDVPRPLDGNNDSVAKWDMGAFEYVNALSDSDGDHMPDRDEIIAGTSPTNGLSLMAITNILQKGDHVQVFWVGGTSATQLIEYSDGLATTGSSWSVLKTNVPPTSIAGSHVDSNTTSKSRFYRIAIPQ